MLDVEWIEVTDEDMDPADSIGYFDRGDREVTIEEAADCTLAAELGCLVIGRERQICIGVLEKEAAKEILNRAVGPISDREWACTREWMKLAYAKAQHLAICTMLDGLVSK